MAPTSTWQLDSQGNRYAAPARPRPAPTRRATTSTKPAGGGYNPDGTDNYIPFGSGDYARPDVRRMGRAPERPPGWRATDRESYDALGRLVSGDGTAGGANRGPFLLRRQPRRRGAGRLRQGVRPVRLGPRRAVGAAGPPRGDDQRRQPRHPPPQPAGRGPRRAGFALSDAAGSTTAVAGIDGTVLERYVYDANGRPQALGADWSAYLAAVPRPHGAHDADASPASTLDVPVARGPLPPAVRPLWITARAARRTTDRALRGRGFTTSGGGGTWYGSYDGRPAAAGYGSGGRRLQRLRPRAGGAEGADRRAGGGGSRRPRRLLPARPEVGIPVNAAINAWQRYNDEHQDLEASLFGGFGDATGLAHVRYHFKCRHRLSNQMPPPYRCLIYPLAPVRCKSPVELSALAITGLAVRRCGCGAEGALIRGYWRMGFGVFRGGAPITASGTPLTFLLL